MTGCQRLSASTLQTVGLVRVGPMIIGNIVFSVFAYVPYTVCSVLPLIAAVEECQIILRYILRNMESVSLDDLLILC